MGQQWYSDNPSFYLVQGLSMSTNTLLYCIGTHRKLNRRTPLPP